MANTFSSSTQQGLPETRAQDHGAQQAVREYSRILNRKGGKSKSLPTVRRLRHCDRALESASSCTVSMSSRVWAYVAASGTEMI